MNSMQRLIFPFVLFVMIAGNELSAAVVHPADTVAPERKNVFSTGLGFQHGFIFAHSDAVQNTRGARPGGVELIASWQRVDKTVWNLCNCFPRKGILLSYYDYNTPVLGKGFHGAYFLEPVYKLNRKLFFSFRGAAGLSYLTDPYHPQRNPENNSYSTTVNGYLLLGAGLWLPVTPHWWINTSVNYQHQSNGGLRTPNKGINLPSAGITISYQEDNFHYNTGAYQRQHFLVNSALRWDVGIFAIAKRSLDEFGNSRRLPVIGVTVQASKQIGRISALTAGIEVLKDYAVEAQLKRDAIDASAFKAGMLAGHEFLLGKFIFSQRLGVYVFDQTPYFDQIYHRWGILYRLNKHAGIGFNLQAHRQVADFIDIRAVYSFQQAK
jgi:hypothetical protein